MTRPVHLKVEFLQKGEANPTRIQFSTKESVEIYMHENVVEVGLKASMTPEAFRDAHKKLGAFLREKRWSRSFYPRSKTK